MSGRLRAGAGAAAERSQRPLRRTPNPGAATPQGIR